MFISDTHSLVDMPAREPGSRQPGHSELQPSETVDSLRMPPAARSCIQVVPAKEMTIDWTAVSLVPGELRMILEECVQSWSECCRTRSHVRFITETSSEVKLVSICFFIVAFASLIAGIVRHSQKKVIKKQKQRYPGKILTERVK